MPSSVVDRFARQSAVVSTPALRATDATLIGVGAVGRQLALQLAALGVGRLRLVDPDTVEETNVTTQGYRRGQLGQLKVEASAEDILAVDPSIVVDRVPGRYRPATGVSPVVFCCVDSIGTRAAIWRSLRDEAEFWCDARVRGEVLRVFTAVDDAGRARYDASLFPPAEAQRGPCSARGLVYTAAIAAGLMAAQLAKWRRGVRPDLEVSLNLLAGEMQVEW